MTMGHTSLVGTPRVRGNRFPTKSLDEVSAQDVGLRTRVECVSRLVTGRGTL